MTRLWRESTSTENPSHPRKNLPKPSPHPATKNSFLNEADRNPHLHRSRHAAGSRRHRQRPGGGRHAHRLSKTRPPPHLRHLRRRCPRRRSTTRQRLLDNRRQNHGRAHTSSQSSSTPPSPRPAISTSSSRSQATRYSHIIDPNNRPGPDRPPHCDNRRQNIRGSRRHGHRRLRCTLATVARRTWGIHRDGSSPHKSWRRRSIPRSFANLQTTFDSPGIGAGYKPSGPGFGPDRHPRRGL